MPTITMSLSIFCGLAVSGIAATVWLMRQSAVLLTFLGPRTALVTVHGPKIGSTIVPFRGNDTKGRPFQFPSSSSAKTLLIYAEAQCNVCGNILADLHWLRSEHRDTSILVLMPELLSTNELPNWAKDLPAPVIVSDEIATGLGLALSPYCLLFSNDGTLLAKGLVNYVEDVESLFMAARFQVTA